MLTQERIKDREVVLKLYVEIDGRIKEVYKQAAIKIVNRNERGGKARLSNSEIITILVMGCWMVFNDKAKLYYQTCVITPLSFLIW